MKVVILAGGIGSRLAEETHLRPKPMVEIGDRPILWHIMKLYSHFGFNDFIVCVGYKGYLIKEYFSNFVLHNADVTIDLARQETTFHQTAIEPWRVTLIDTGAATLTGGRLKRVAHLLDPQEPFCLTYGDGIADIDIVKLVEFHRRSGLEATLTAVQPPGRFGATRLNGVKVESFVEKPIGEGGYVNGGFFVLNPSVLARIEGDDTAWERDPLEKLAADGQLAAYRHQGFWHAMDTLRDKNHLTALVESGEAPWVLW